jgi:type III restriction enzyme
MIMDESHHYRADAGLKAINDLKPILGLELTATPTDSRGAKFKNVVFEYPLSRAMEDGFVKEPAVATRKDFDPDQYKNDQNSLDLIKLSDGIKLHEVTKASLDIYARDNKEKLIKPFVLVVAKDTDHARDLRALIDSEQFFGGQYRGKVMEIHSSTRGGEKEENVQRMLTLEEPDNPIEVVIHVNMLKEGWDVTNLYTIIPLRASNSQILTEQTIGRGLRLPYGKRTGSKPVDTLTIVAHDKFQAIVDAANSEGSIIRMGNIIEIDPAELPDAQEVFTVQPITGSAVLGLRQTMNRAATEEERNSASRALLMAEAAESVILEMAGQNYTVEQLDSPAVREQASVLILKVAPPQDSTSQEEALAAFDQVASAYKKHVISIPRIKIKQGDDTISGFTDFDLDVRGLNLQPVSEDLIRRNLRTNESDIVQAVSMDFAAERSPVNILTEELANYPEVDYDRDAILIQKLLSQALAKLSSGHSDKDTENIVSYHKRDIAKFIYTQMREHLFVTQGDYEEVEIQPFSRIEPWNYTRGAKDAVRGFTETITPTSAIKNFIFGGFSKACHPNYKFDSKAEKDFATVLEDQASDEVIRWMRPAPGQFRIYWDHNSRIYIPDFVVESKEVIYMVEIKAENELKDGEVLAKARAGISYTEICNLHREKLHGKRWEYLLIPHTQINFNTSFGHAAERFVLTKQMIEDRKSSR